MIRAALAALILAGCAVQPITAAPAADVAACEQVADLYSRFPRVAERTGIGAIKGFAIGAAVNGAKLVIPKAGAATISMGSFALPMAAFGLLEGLIETADRRAEIVRTCLRDRGARAY